MQQQFAAKWTAAAAAAATTTLERAIRESATRKLLPLGQV